MRADKQEQYFVRCKYIKKTAQRAVLQCRHQPIFPGRLRPSIFGTCELNFRVRDGNGCTLTVINTDCCVIPERKYDITTTDLKMQVFF